MAGRGWEWLPVVEELPVGLDLDPLSPLPQNDRFLVWVLERNQYTSVTAPHGPNSVKAPDQADLSKCSNYLKEFQALLVLPEENDKRMKGMHVLCSFDNPRHFKEYTK